jgi:hypothetical protein
MSEHISNTLSPLSPEDFKSMIEGDAPVEVPFGIDLILAVAGVDLEDSDVASQLVCNPRTGDGSGEEDEYPPRYEVFDAGDVNNLN